MRATTHRPNTKLVSVKQAEAEYGLPATLLRDLVHRRELAAVQPPNIRRVFIVRADLERQLERWKVRP